MWNFINSLSLNRYLIALRVNAGLVRSPRYWPVEFSLVLAHVIAERLPTQQARPWRKYLEGWQPYGGVRVVGREKPPVPPEVAWPLPVTWWFYPTVKTDYTKDELIYLELKLFTDAADHGLFLELILPALEFAGYNVNVPWSGQTTLWGHYEIHSIWAAHGKQWQPVVQASKLDLRSRVLPNQWAEGLDFSFDTKRKFTEIRWVTPFDFAPPQPIPEQPRPYFSPKNVAVADAPNLRTILEALIERMTGLLPGKYHTPEDVWKAADADEQFSLLDALEQGRDSVVRRHSLKPVEREWPGRWLGSQVFAAPIPLATWPYLELASILHVGRQTHLGCGTFYLA
jgi:hypothetical protein